MIGYCCSQCHLFCCLDALNFDTRLTGSSPVSDWLLGGGVTIETGLLVSTMLPEKTWKDQMVLHKIDTLGLTTCNNRDNGINNIEVPWEHTTFVHFWFDVKSDLIKQS